MDNIIVSIVTTTYNRKEKIGELYKSLLSQTDKRFEWIIIDDGSIDQTEQRVKSFIRENHIRITYRKKENQGKHIALNESHSLIQGKYVVIVDSDDTLISDAVKLIIFLWKKYESNLEIACVTFQKETQRGEISDLNIQGEYISTLSKEFYHGFRGDHCEVFRTEAFISKKFPVFYNERFLAEGPMWYLITKGKSVVYTDKVIYRFEYLPDGLTSNIRRIMAKNPQGAYWNATKMISDDFSLKVRLKYSILAMYYGRLCGKELKIIRKDVRKYHHFLLSILPYILISVLWKKYEDR